MISDGLSHYYPLFHRASPDSAPLASDSVPFALVTQLFLQYVQHETATSSGNKIVYFIVFYLIIYISTHYFVLFHPLHRVSWSI